MVREGEEENATGRGGEEENTTGRGGEEENATGRGGEEENTTGRGGEEENASCRGRGRRRMPLVGEEENGVHEWGTQSHTCKHGIHNMLCCLEYS